MNHMLGQQCMDTYELDRFIKSKSCTIECESGPVSSLQHLDKTLLFQQRYAKTLYLGNKEASGTGIVDLFMFYVLDTMEIKYPDATLKVDHQYRILENKLYAADETIGVVVVINAKAAPSMLPILVLEYKPRVSQDLGDQEPSHLSETFMQAYYLRKRCKFPVMHCLTDLNDFHFFLIEDEHSGVIKISRYYYLKCDLKDGKQLIQMMTFLYHTLNVPV